MDQEIIQQYKEAISNALSFKQVEVLRVLYYFPESSATAKELAKALNYTGYHAANLRVGTIGRMLSNYVKVALRERDNGKGIKPAYYELVGKYYKNEGWVMWPELRAALEELNLVSNEQNSEVGMERLPTEIQSYEEGKFFMEGKLLKIYVNRFERNLKARLSCINHFGANCYACGFDFEKVYGELASGFIHVHHKKPINEIKKEYEIDAINDLVPLCPNCHSVVHLTNPPLTIDELKTLIKKNK